jgi:6-pyruvoyltetrahydropterin/6-carboxytetrahydropterin synthase
MKHIIDKSFSFCYGHRVHNQRLDTQFTESGEACLACRHLHGHEGLIKVFLEEEVTGKNVNDYGMVTDFKHLGWFKNFLDDVLDHKMILDLKDPLLKEECSYLLDDSGEFSMELVHKMPEGYWVPDLTIIRETLDNYISKYSFDKDEAQAIFEKYEGMVFVDFVPTSENLAGWLLQTAQNKMEGPNGIPNVRVAAVEYWETPKSHCRVEA